MKILFVATELQKASGITTFVENVAEELRAEGHGVDCIDVRDVVGVKNGEITLSSTSTSNLNLSSYDIVHLHGLWRPMLHKIASSITTSRTSQTSQTSSSSHLPRLVWSTHGMTAPWSMRHKWWKKCLVWWLWQKPLLRRAALIHSTVEQEAEWNRKLGLGVGNRCSEIIVPLGTYLPQNSFNAGACGTRRIRPDLNAYAPSASQPDGISASGPTVPNVRTLLFVGRVYPVKALDNLIRAFELSNVPGWTLRIVGPDQSGHTAELIALCQKLGVKNVEFTGPKFGAELDEEYANCDILALVSHTENFGATVVDAMAHGKPVITSTATPWKEVVGGPSSPEGFAAASGKAGWWVDNDVDSLTDCLRAALTTPPSTLAQMGARGRSLVESKYTWRAVASRLAKAYEELVG